MTSHKHIVLAASVLCISQATQMIASEANTISRLQEENSRLRWALLEKDLLHATEKFIRTIDGSTLETRQKRLLCAAAAITIGCSGYASAYILSQQP